MRSDEFSIIIGDQKEKCNEEEDIYLHLTSPLLLLTQIADEWDEYHGNDDVHAALSRALSSFLQTKHSRTHHSHCLNFHRCLLLLVVSRTASINTSMMPTMKPRITRKYTDLLKITPLIKTIIPTTTLTMIIKISAFLNFFQKLELSPRLV
jgi:hypothetical protein